MEECPTKPLRPELQLFLVGGFRRRNSKRFRTASHRQQSNLYVALQRVVEARALAGVSRADLFPQITLDPSYSNTGTLFELYGISGIPAIVALGIKPTVRAHVLQYYFPVNLNYEIDLWGKLSGEI